MTDVPAAYKSNIKRFCEASAIYHKKWPNFVIFLFCPSIFSFLWLQINSQQISMVKIFLNQTLNLVEKYLKPIMKLVFKSQKQLFVSYSTPVSQISIIWNVYQTHCYFHIFIFRVAKASLFHVEEILHHYKEMKCITYYSKAQIWDMLLQQNLSIHSRFKLSYLVRCLSFWRNYCSCWGVVILSTKQWHDLNSVIWIQ